MSSIAYYHKIAGSKPSCLSQAYLIGLKFKKLKYDKSVDIHLVIDLVIDSVAVPPCSDIYVSDIYNNFSLSRPRKPLQ